MTTYRVVPITKRGNMCVVCIDLIGYLDKTFCRSITSSLVGSFGQVLKPSTFKYIVFF